jgi:NAD+ kinase
MTKKALVIYKKSLYQIYVQEKKNPHIAHLLAAGDVSVKEMLASHEENAKTVERVLGVLNKHGFSTRARYRGDASMVRDDTAIVFSVGGDGTFLWTQKYVGVGVPVFGVNSDPGRSVGFLCTAEKDNFEQRLTDYLQPEEQKTFGCPTPVLLQRMKVEVNGTVIADRVLNDVLFCHKNPAAMSTYFLNGESQKSSGVWVATSAGSTGAMKSAGGTPMPWSYPSFQFRAREPYNPSGKYEFSHGFVKAGDSLHLISKMREAIIAPDGARDLHHVKMGDKITISHSSEPLTWIKML